MGCRLRQRRAQAPRQRQCRIRFPCVQTLAGQRCWSWLSSQNKLEHHVCRWHLGTETRHVGAQPSNKHKAACRVVLQAQKVKPARHGARHGDNGKTESLQAVRTWWWLSGWSCLIGNHNGGRRHRWVLLKHGGCRVAGVRHAGRSGIDPGRRGDRLGSCRWWRQVERSLIAACCQGH